MAPTFRHGRSTKVFIDNYDMSVILNSASFDASVDTPESTPFGSDDRQYVVGQRDATLTFEGMVDVSTDQLDGHFDTQLGATTNSIITWTPAGASVGARAEMAEGIQTARGVTSPISGVVAASVDYQATNGPKFGLCLTSTAAQATATTWASAQDGSTQSTKGGVAFLHVLEGHTTGAGDDIVVAVQDSSNDVAFADLISFTVNTTGTGSVTRTTVAGNIHEYVRARVTSQSSTSITYVLAFARNR